MQAAVGVETRPEVALRRAVHAAGLRFRKDCRPLADYRCAADIVFPGEKVCVFVDGCFWHACPRHFRLPGSHSAWWAEKIQANVERDRRQSAYLRRRGWTVVRIWEHQIRRGSLAAATARVLRAVRRRREAAGE
jgi:DNA mismatch endonuclease (patch repair protein)